MKIQGLNVVFNNSESMLKLITTANEKMPLAVSTTFENIPLELMKLGLPKELDIEVI